MAAAAIGVIARQSHNENTSIKRIETDEWGVDLVEVSRSQSGHLNKED